MSSTDGWAGLWPARYPSSTYNSRLGESPCSANTCGRSGIRCMSILLSCMYIVAADSFCRTPPFRWAGSHRSHELELKDDL